MRHTFHFTCSLLLCFIGPLLRAEDHGWPTSPRPSFSVENQSAEKEGFQIQWLSLKSSSLSLRWMPVGPWYKAQKQGSGASIVFGHRMAPELRMNLILYPKGTWLGDLGQQSVERYLSSLGAQFPEASVTVLNPGSITPPVGSIPFLGGPYRQIHFTVTPDAPGGQAVSFYDYLTAKDGALLVVRYEAPAEMLERMESRLVRELFFFEVE